MVVLPLELIVHYHHCSTKKYGDVFIDFLNVQLFFLKNVLNCSFLQLVAEIHPYNNHGPYPYAYNMQEGKILYKEEIVDYMKNMYNFDWAEYAEYFGVIEELKILLIYYLWGDENIYNKFTKEIYRERFFFLYYYFIIKKLKKENLQECCRRGLDNHHFNILRLKRLLDILDDVLGETVKLENRKQVTYFDSACFSILSIFYSIPSKLNYELHEVLMSKPNLIHYLKNLNMQHKIWSNERSFLLGIKDL